MKAEIDKKRKELIGEVEDSCKKLITVISNSSLSNKNYKDYTEAISLISDTSNRVLDFNGAMDEFFKEST